MMLERYPRVFVGWSVGAPRVTSQTSSEGLVTERGRDGRSAGWVNSISCADNSTAVRQPWPSLSGDRLALTVYEVVR